MKQIDNILVLIVLVLTILTIPYASAEDAPAMYFVPDGGTCDCGGVTTIDLMVNTSANVGGIQAQIDFDPTCINITNVSYAGCSWQLILEEPGWAHYGNNIRLAAMNPAGVLPGVHKMAVLTVECVGCNCTSDMTLSDIEPVASVIYNTTLTCSGSSEPDPDVATISIGDGTNDVTIPIMVNATNLGSCDINMTYDETVVEVVSVTDGNMDNYAVNIEHTADGWLRIGAFQSDNSGMTGVFTLASIVLTPVSVNSQCPLVIAVNTLKDATTDTTEMAYTISNGMYYSSLNGDANGDGMVDIADAMYIARHVVGIAGYETIDEGTADVTGDGVIDIADAMYLAKHVAGITGFEELR